MELVRPGFNIALRKCGQYRHLYIWKVDVKSQSYVSYSEEQHDTWWCSGLNLGSLHKDHTWKCLGNPMVFQGVEPRSATYLQSQCLPHSGPITSFSLTAGNCSSVRHGHAHTHDLQGHREGESANGKKC